MNTMRCRLPHLRVSMLVLLLCCGVGAARQASSAAGARPPNVVLIVADDLGYECLTANGSASYRTPHLDRLAAGGARFTHCYTPPLCTPTRVQLMTGRYNFRNYTRFGTLVQGEKTFAHMLKAAGYNTAVVGKWQLDESGGQQPADAGFDEYCLWNISLEGHRALGDRYADPNLIYLDRESGKPAFRRYEGEYGPDVNARYLYDFMQRSVRAGKPFLAYYPMILTHNPFQPTPESAEWKSGDRHQAGPRFFADMVGYMDSLVGELVRKVDELGIRENTLILFVGDNGTNLSITSRMKDGRTVRGGKSMLTEAGTHVPFIANWPGTIPAGQVRDDLVDTTDFAPAIAEATGAAMPKPPGDGVIDGKSFLTPLKRRAPGRREWVLVDYRARAAAAGKDGRFARDRRWKLYGFGAGGSPLYRSGELYEVTSDPEEARPVAAGGAEADAARARLQRVLDTMKAAPR
jgi:arylsulfatase A